MFFKVSTSFPGSILPGGAALRFRTHFSPDLLGLAPLIAPPPPGVELPPGWPPFLPHTINQIGLWCVLEVAVVANAGRAMMTLTKEKMPKNKEFINETRLGEPQGPKITNTRVIDANASSHARTTIAIETVIKDSGWAFVISSIADVVLNNGIPLRDTGQALKIAAQSIEHLSLTPPEMMYLLPYVPLSLIMITALFSMIVKYNWPKKYNKEFNKERTKQLSNTSSADYADDTEIVHRPF